MTTCKDEMLLYKMAKTYHYGGDIVEKDLEQAFKWYVVAAERGSELAAFPLGEMYCDGKGVEKNEERGAYWLNIAAKNGTVYAMKRLANLYYDGKGIERNPKEAARLYQVVVNELENARVEKVRLAHLYYAGDGVEKNQKRALQLYNEAGQVDEQAFYNVGMIHYEGQVVEQDFDIAMKCFVNAGTDGYAKASYMVGHMYQYEIGGYKTPGYFDDEYCEVEDKVIEWYTRALEQGYTEAKKAIAKYKATRGKRFFKSLANYWNSLPDDL